MDIQLNITSHGQHFVRGENAPPTYVRFNKVVEAPMHAFYLTFYNYCCPNGIFPWEIQVAFPGVSRLRCRISLPNLPIFNVHIDVNACNCTRGCTDIAREPALKVDSGRKIPCITGESNLRQRRAGPMLYQLSYIPARLHVYRTNSLSLVDDPPVPFGERGFTERQ